jgi:hemerythrin-like domain-containing protein
MSNTSPMTFVGHRAPSAGFDSPFDMLEACHERVRRMLTLLTRLEQHLHQHGCDHQARQAAVDVMRYFDQAAPLHHQDEELHVFPLLLESADPSLHAVVQTLLEQHKSMEQIWARLRSVLQDLSRCEDGQSFTGLPAGEVQAFSELYAQHIRLEEHIVYPKARAALTPEGLRVIGEDMMTRRGVKPVVW